ncbi:DUF397 domain-containing protein [Streptomyces sp. NPDC093085]|uniref:DUF397 domain-containing protein n=1 Tax=Streptomyces sp. NPDC093085 TaxID=3155068 RepID=UPI003429B901
MNTRDLADAQWQKSTYSDQQGGDCIEFSRTFTRAGVIRVRDSKNPDGPTLLTTPAAWGDFTAYASANPA